MSNSELISEMVQIIDRIIAVELGTDDLVRLGVSSLLINLGECANGVSEDSKAASASVPWKRIVGLRNVLAHQRSADQEKVQQALDDLPRIRGVLIDYLEEWRS